MKVTGFGDYLFHFSPIHDERFMQTDYMQPVRKPMCAPPLRSGVKKHSSSPDCQSTFWPSAVSSF